MIKQITTAGCNRECFALTDDGELYLLKYNDRYLGNLSTGDRPHPEMFKWEKIEAPSRREA